MNSIDPLKLNLTINDMKKLISWFLVLIFSTPTALLVGSPKIGIVPTVGNLPLSYVYTYGSTTGTGKTQAEAQAAATRKLPSGATVKKTQFNKINGGASWICIIFWRKG